MKPVRLIDFFKRLSERGVDLKGCVIREGSRNYRFIRIEGNSLMVSHGASFEREGALSNMLQVVSIPVVGDAKRRLAGAHSINGLIVVNFKDFRRW
jgi:hypothetical protein